MVGEIETSESLFLRASRIPRETVIVDDEGYTISYDPDECLELLLRAALMGHVIAQYALGCYEMNKDKLMFFGIDCSFNSGKSSADWFSRAMRQGDSKSAYYYAYSMYYTNNAECIRMLRELASEGLVVAQNSLSELGYE